MPFCNLTRCLTQKLITMKKKTMSYFSNFQMNIECLKNVLGGIEERYGTDSAGRRYVEWWGEDGVRYRRYLSSVA